MAQRFSLDILNDANKQQLFRLLQSLAGEIEALGQEAAALRSSMRSMSAAARVSATGAGDGASAPIAITSSTLLAIRAALQATGSAPLSIESLPGIAAQSQRGFAVVAASAGALPNPALYEVGTIGAVLSGSTLTFYLVSAGNPRSWTAQTSLSLTAIDNSFTIEDNADGTKKIRFEVSGVSAGATRVLTAPDYDGTLATLAGTETLTNKTLTTPTVGNLTNMQHPHTNAAGGGQLTVAAHSDYASADIAYAAGNFTASSGNWTVDAGDQTALWYLRFGRLLVVAFTIEATDVSATPTDLRITLPNSYAAASDSHGVFWASNAGGAWAPGMWSVAVGGTFIELYRDPLATVWSTTAADNTSVTGVAVIRI